MADSISGASDTEFLAMVDTLRTALVAHAADYPSITAAMKADLDTYRDSFNDVLNAHQLAQAGSKSTRIAKDTKRDEGNTKVRNIVNINKAAGVDDAKMTQLGVPKSSDKAPANATVPLAVVDTSKRLHHTISFRDAGTPENKKKPRGVVGAEIWVKIGSPEPSDVRDCVFLGLDTLTPYTANYEADEAGKMAYYMLRWSMRDGTVTPFGETVSATITG